MKTRKKLAAVALSIGAVIGTGGAAFALTYSPDPVHVGDTITVTSTSTDLPKGDIRVSVCTTKRYGLFQVPACTKVPNPVNFQGGQLVHAFTLPETVDLPNAHSFFPAQGDTFRCDAPGLCEILIVDHNGVFSNTLEREPITILP